MVSPVFRSSSSAQDIAGTATSLGVANPAGLTNGDGQYLWAWAFTASAGSPVLTAPSGWTQYGSTQTWSFGTGVDASVALYYRIASGDGTATFSSDRASYMVGLRAAYQNAHPVDWASGVTLTSGTTASGTSHAAGSITTTRPNQLTTWLLIGDTASNWAPPGAVTERDDLGSPLSISFGDAVEAAAGATGSRTFTSSVTLTSFWARAAFNPNNVAQRYMGMKLRGR